MTERLLDANEVAELLHVPVSWVRESTRSGAIPHIRLGRYRRYREADVTRWLEECSRPGRPIAVMATAGHRSMTTTKGYLHLAGVVFRDEASALERRLLGVQDAGTKSPEPAQLSEIS